MVLLKTVLHWVKKKAEIFEREVEEPIEVEDDEEDGDDTIEDKCLEKSTSTQLISAIDTLLELSFFNKVR